MVLQNKIVPGGYSQQSYTQDGYCSTDYGYGPYGNRPSMHMGPTPVVGSPHMIPSGGYGPHHQPQWHSTSTDYYTHGSSGHMSRGSHGMATTGYGSPFHGHGGIPGPVGAKVEPMNYEYHCSYGNGRTCMFQNPMEGHQSTEWKLKSIEDDD